MNIEEKAAQIVAAAEVVTVASIDENGYPRPVAMVKLKDENGACDTQYTKEEAIAEMKKHFPTLKRWKKVKF